ncbi:hypothetical protein RF11_00757 [Thelohanellus kitauei]|uniref:Uncharacterized protein n=1 Tax=Thelohanellus kitauei TaxID=669202 RepID=A0A0C2NAA4_THEKT|nr:hypothetical protein RF11_00757 [Thelohanellus kitauei]
MKQNISRWKAKVEHISGQLMNLTHKFSLYNHSITSRDNAIHQIKTNMTKLINELIHTNFTGHSQKKRKHLLEQVDLGTKIGNDILHDQEWLQSESRNINETIKRLNDQQGRLDGRIYRTQSRLHQLEQNNFDDFKQERTESNKNILINNGIL